MMNARRRINGTASYLAPPHVRVDRVNPNFIRTVGLRDVSGEAKPAGGIEASNS